MPDVQLISPEQAEVMVCEYCEEVAKGVVEDGWTQIGRSRRRLLAEGDNPTVLASWCPADELKIKHHNNPTQDQLVALRDELIGATT